MFILVRFSPVQHVTYMIGCIDAPPVTHNKSTQGSRLRGWDGTSGRAPLPHKDMHMSHGSDATFQMDRFRALCTDRFVVLVSTQY
jgi:hypothetical protein